jgi:hypothetical protein
MPHLRCWAERFKCKCCRAMKLLTAMSMIVALCCASCSRSPTKASATTSRFQTGQVWAFQTSTNELPGAKLTVVRVDFDPKEGSIVFISVTGVRHHTWDSTNMFYPFSEDALNRSVVALVGTNAPLTGEDLKSFQDFYEITRQGIAAGKLDKCFKITMAEVFEAAQKQELEEAKQRSKPWPWWKFWQ